MYIHLSPYPASRIQGWHQLFRNGRMGIFTGDDSQKFTHRFKVREHTQLEIVCMFWNLGESKSSAKNNRNTYTPEF